jgi:NADPH-dependent curcumin reductase CurA
LHHLPLPRAAGWERHDEPWKTAVSVAKATTRHAARDDFSLETGPVPTAPEGGLVVRNRYISLDPAQRGWMDDAPSYMPPIPLEPVRATTVGVVHESRNPDFAPGDWVLGLNGVEDYSVVTPGGFTSKIDVSIVDRPSLSFGRGRGGPHRLFRPDRRGRAARGETLLVTGAAGAVGSMVGQIGKILGLRVIGIAGGAEKCRRLVEDYGFDVAIDYKGKSQAASRRKSPPPRRDGVDILFENVGGDVMDAVLLNLALHARVVLCGLDQRIQRARKDRHPQPVAGDRQAGDDQGLPHRRLCPPLCRRWRRRGAMAGRRAPARGRGYPARAGQRL